MNRAINNIAAAWALVLMIHAAGHVFASEINAELAREINSANESVRTGDYDSAIAAYARVRESEPNNEQTAYNNAVALYRNGDMAAAEGLLQIAAASDVDDLAAKARFNLGNCHYAAALQLASQDREAAIKHLHEAIGQYRSALDIDRSDADARANIELAANLIDQLKQEQKSDEQNQQQDQQDQQQDQKDQQQDQNQEQQQKDQESQQQEQAGQEQERQQQEQAGQQQDQKNQRQDTNGQQEKREDQQQDQPSPSEQAKQESAESAAPQTDSPQEQPEQDRTRQRQDGQSPDNDEEASDPEQSEEQETTTPEGELTAAQKTDNADDNNEPSTVRELAEDGVMTEEEARKMLQAIRDRDMLRRLRRQAAQRSRRARVDKDW